jgi:hypothetical protein
MYAIASYLFNILISAAISYAIGLLLKKSPKSASVGKMDITNPDAKSPVPVCFGTNIIKGANVIWYGNPKTTSVKTGSSGK